MSASDLPPGITEDDQARALITGRDLSIHPDCIRGLREGGGDAMTDERLDDESMRITSDLLREVRAGLARGVNPEEGEPDDHKAVNAIEAEAVRARASETALVAEVRRLRANAATAVAFLEKRYGNRGGNDWGDDEAAHIAELLDGNVDG